MMNPTNDIQTPEKLISRALRSLDNDLRQILILHNGNRDTPGLSFEALTDRLDRPIQDLITAEKTAIRNLRRPPAAGLIVEALRKSDNVIWQALAGADNVVYKDNLNQQIAACLPGELLIGIKCVYDNVQNWLYHHAYQNRIAWYRSECPKNVMQGVLKKLTGLKGRLQTPLPYRRLAEQMNIDRRLLKQALALAKNRFEIYRGYVCGLHMGARTLRAVRLHLMFFYRYPNQFLSLEQIHAEYLDTYSDDDAITRDIFLAMGDNPHLFMKLGSFGWYSIMTTAGQDPYQQKNTSTKLHQPDKDKVQFFFKRPAIEPSMLNLINEFVQRQGMARPKEIESYIREKHTERVNESTQIAALIAGSHELFQVAPTVYALRETHGNLDPQSAQAEMLLTKSDLRWYVMSRHAGEPMNTFPLWTPAMERMWCRWAQKRATNPARSRLFQSMMSVADPGCWPVSDDEKRSWLEIKKWNSSYYLRHDCKHRIWSKILPLRDLLVLSFCISKTTGMNWIRVNRAAGYYLFDQHSITHLAVMIALGALKSTDHWQNPHQIGPAIEYIFKKLMDAFQIDPASNWDSDVGLELRKHLLDLDVDQGPGWINVEDLALLSKSLAGEPIIPSVDDAEEPNPASNLLPKQLELPF
jgi:hypothetical protein